MEIKSRVPGKIIEFMVKEGDTVKAKDVIATMEAMKMKQKVPAPIDGVVKSIKLNPGDRVAAGTVIMVIE